MVFLSTGTDYQHFFHSLVATRKRICDRLKGKPSNLSHEITCDLFLGVAIDIPGEC